MRRKFRWSWPLAAKNGTEYGRLYLVRGVVFGFYDRVAYYEGTFLISLCNHVILTTLWGLLLAMPLHNLAMGA